jgi:putative peptidoglycan lipid II flippase
MPPFAPPITRTAFVIMAGTLASSMLGLVRAQVIAGIFGQTAQVGAWFAALKTPQQVSDVLIGGAVSAALIPTFARYAAPERRRSLARLFSATTLAVALGLAVVAGMLMLLAPVLVPTLNPGFAPAMQGQTVALVRILALGLPGMGVCAVALALLFALRRALLPALAAGLLHLGVIVGALCLAPRLGVASLALGLLLGTATQAVVLLIAIRRLGITLRIQHGLLWHHPALRGLLRLYAPTALGLLVGLALQVIDQGLQSRVIDPATGVRGGPSVAALANATMLIQFPAGLVAAALGFAVLPPLAQAAHSPDHAARIVRRALALGLALMLPICLLYLVGSVPLVALLLQHHAFSAVDTARTALALRCFAGELPFLTIEQVALAAWFARRAPRVPLLASLVSAGAYLAVAMPLAPRLGMPALAFANLAQHAANALLLLALLARRIPLFTRRAEAQQEEEEWRASA